MLEDERLCIQDGKLDKPSKDMPLKRYHVIQARRMQALLMKIDCKEAWLKEENVQAISAFMEDAAYEMSIYYDEVNRLAGGSKDQKADPAKMVEIMVLQGEGFHEFGISYAYAYFYNSICDFYHKARGYLVGKTRFKLTDGDVNIFFDKEAPQNRWGARNVPPRAV